MRTPRATSPANGGLGLMQERLRNRPWALLVGCVLYNRVQGARAWPVLSKFLRDYPTHESFVAAVQDASAKAVSSKLTAMFEPLGLQTRRAKNVVALAEAWFDQKGVDVAKLPGCGRYAAESFEIFVRGNLVARPQDKELRRYVKWARALYNHANERIGRR